MFHSDNCVMKPQLCLVKKMPDSKTPPPPLQKARVRVASALAICPPGRETCGRCRLPHSRSAHVRERDGSYYTWLRGHAKRLFLILLTTKIFRSDAFIRDLRKLAHAAVFSQGGAKKAPNYEC